MVDDGAREVAPGPGDSRAWRHALLIVLAAAAVRGLLSWLVPLVPDETYYWEWSRNPAAS